MRSLRSCAPVGSSQARTGVARWFGRVLLVSLFAASAATAACDSPDGGAPPVIEPGAPVVVETPDAPTALATWGMCVDGSEPTVEIENRRISLVCPEGALRLRALCEVPDVSFSGGLVRVGCVRPLAGR